jgi:hypothetical protein
VGVGPHEHDVRACGCCDERSRGATRVGVGPTSMTYAPAAVATSETEEPRKWGSGPRA